MTDRELQPSDVWKAIRDIRVAMLTAEEEGQLVSRPMSSLVREEDGKIYFVSRLDAKVQEIGRSERVNLAYSDPNNNLYVSLSGTAQTSQDREKLHELWSMWVEAWLPEGPDGPDVVLITVSPDAAKMWDATSSRLVYAGKVLKAVATQRPPDGGDVAVFQMHARGEEANANASGPDAATMTGFEDAMSDATDEVGASSVAGPTS
jgi:general stress protein 26